MKAVKECISCGALNDVIFSNCLFCRTSLPVIDYDSISNEQLVMNASDWVARVSEPYFEIRDPHSNDWTGRGIQRIIHGEIVGNAQKYLVILQIRSQSNSILQEVYDDLHSQFVVNKQKGETQWHREGRHSQFFDNRIMLTFSMILAFVIMIGVAIAIAVGEINQNELLLKEKERLEHIEAQINTAILDGDYEAAGMLVPQLRYSGPDIHLKSGSKKQDNYDLIREELTDKINSLKNPADGNN